MWEPVTDLGHEITERLAVAGGWLYRTAFAHPRSLGVEPLSGAAVTFVPGDSAPAPAKSLIILPTEPTHEEAQAVEVHEEAHADDAGREST